MTKESGLPGEQAEALLRELATWGNTTTIILHGGCVFEFKGLFPAGEIGHGYYNLKGTQPGFEGHINLEAIDHIDFQDKPHRGRESYAFTFQDKDNNNIFKVFIGRDEQGVLLPEQVKRFKQIQQHSAL
ncbi:MAG: heme utilization cystosolic carrier protein HutX [Neptuniibacter caesariensis]|uniref:Heme utilization cystosolic carrier protein HutX n=1 Tax=Neptuniibacter caesariensis TaxID=207954 RepID=A0A2G6JRK5_NEPCE|nr:MAG: heme utilization cystosolic carrier protein HutX [Neptuniibacter caesariensis]